MAQGKRARPITLRSLDRNELKLINKTLFGDEA